MKRALVLVFAVSVFSISSSAASAKVPMGMTGETRTVPRITIASTIWRATPKCGSSDYLLRR
jgi:hypothetical protein